MFGGRLIRPFLPGAGVSNAHKQFYCVARFNYSVLSFLNDIAFHKGPSGRLDNLLHDASFHNRGSR